MGEIEMLTENQIKFYRSIDPLQLFGDGIIFGVDYRLNALPTDKEEKLLFLPERKDHYTIYLAWLADYLGGRRIEPNERQKDLCRIVSGLPGEHAMRLLGTYAALYEFLLIDIETGIAISERITDPGKYTEKDIDWIYCQSRNYWVAALKDDPEFSPDEDIVNHPEFRQSPREYIIQYLTEEAEREKLYDHPGYQFGDVGWRIPLSLVLRDILNKRERMRLLDNFFDWFDEYASK